MPASDRRSRLAVLLAFATVYVVWGSTYLAIRFAIETLPPFLMAGVRFLVAGAVLYAWVRLRGGPRPAPVHWRNASLVGGLLLLGGNGAVVWAEQWVPSGLAALLVATVPLWMVLLEWLWASGPRPGLPLVAGLAWGLFGVALLTGTPGLGADDPRQLLGGLAVLGGAVSWAFGSILSRHAELPPVTRLATAMQMLAGGALLLLTGLLLGEGGRVEPRAVSLRSALSLVYLILFGSLLAYSAYIWLLRVSTPTRVSTYAFVNPVVALLLGWALADEPLTVRTVVAGFVILTAVVVITRRRPPRAGSGGPRSS